MNVLAHANGTGWDELLLTVTPFLLSATVFVLAKKRPRDATGQDDRGLSPLPAACAAAGAVSPRHDPG